MGAFVRVLIKVRTNPQDDYVEPRYKNVWKAYPTTDIREFDLSTGEVVLEIVHDNYIGKNTVTVAEEDREAFLLRLENA